MRVVKFQLNMVQTAVSNVHSNINDLNEKEEGPADWEPKDTNNTWKHMVAGCSKYKKSKVLTLHIFEYACKF